MSKNVFLDLGFSEDEAIERALRAEIAIRLELLIRSRRLTQKGAAKLFGVPQPTISKIVNGKLANLSLAFLLRMLVKANLPFEIRRGASAEDVEVSIDDRLFDAGTYRSEMVVGAMQPAGYDIAVESSAPMPVQGEVTFGIPALVRS